MDERKSEVVFIEVLYIRCDRKMIMVIDALLTYNQ